MEPWANSGKNGDFSLSVVFPQFRTFRYMYMQRCKVKLQVSQRNPVKVKVDVWENGMPFAVWHHNLANGGKSCLALHYMVWPSSNTHWILGIWSVGIMAYGTLASDLHVAQHSRSTDWIEDEQVAQVCRHFLVPFKALAMRDDFTFTFAILLANALTAAGGIAVFGLRWQGQWPALQ